MFYTWIPIRKRHDETLTFCYFNLDILSYYVFLKHSSTLNYPDCERFERPNAKKRVFVFQARRRMTTWLTTLMPQPILPSLFLSPFYYPDPLTPPLGPQSHPFILFPPIPPPNPIRPFIPRTYPPPPILRLFAFLFHPFILRLRNKHINDPPILCARDRGEKNKGAYKRGGKE